jgi:hypothetical protein
MRHPRQSACDLAISISFAAVQRPTIAHRARQHERRRAANLASGRRAPA